MTTMAKHFSQCTTLLALAADLRDICWLKDLTRQDVIQWSDQEGFGAGSEGEEGKVNIINLLTVKLSTIFGPLNVN